MLYLVPIEGHHIHSGRTEGKNQKTEKGNVFILNNNIELMMMCHYYINVVSLLGLYNIHTGAWLGKNSRATISRNANKGLA